MVAIISPGAMQLKLDKQADVPTILSPRQVRMTWPGLMRIGDKNEIELVFEPVAGTISTSNPSPGFVDAYDSYNLMAEARFEVAGVTVEPAGPIRESLPRGQTVSFKWQISTVQEGTFDGTAWLYLRYLPLDGKTPIDQPVYLLTVTLHSTSFFSLSSPTARLLGGVGLVISASLTAGDLIKAARRRLRTTTREVNGREKIENPERSFVG